MRYKVVSNGKYFKVKKKVPLLPLWIDAGFPRYITFENAQDIVDIYNTKYKDCQTNLLCPKCGSNIIFVLDIYPPIYRCMKCKNEWREEKI